MDKVGRILMAEDNPNDVEIALSGLEECNLANEVVVVRDGAEALDYLYRRGEYADRKNDDPVVILLDIKMPRVDGIEVLRQVRADSAMKNIPIIMLTSSREEKDLVKTYELGVNAYVVKPVDFDQFVKAIQDLGLFWAVLNETPPRSTKS
ncbi:MAG: response regulator [Ignavibacteria bacterium]|jgi:CheY-like chemotaxis protein